MATVVSVWSLPVREQFAWLLNHSRRHDVVSSRLANYSVAYVLSSGLRVTVDMRWHRG
jgi:hypothetical protein